MKITIADTNPEMEIVVERSIFDGIAITQGLDHVYVTEDMIKLFVSAVHAIGYSIFGEELDE